VRLIAPSQTVEHRMVTWRGLPEPAIGDFPSRETPVRRFTVMRRESFWRGCRSNRWRILTRWWSSFMGPECGDSHPRVHAQLGSRPERGFRFSAAPVKVSALGTLPARAFAIEGD
jgi:hypothetical protein